MTSLVRNGLVAGGVGAVALSFGVAIDPRHALTAYLFAYATVLTIVVGALIQLMISRVTGAHWFAAYRGDALAITGALPALALLLIPIVVGIRAIYPWATIATLPVETREIVARKVAWLNVPFFVGRGALYFVVWLLIAETFRRWSTARFTATMTSQSSIDRRLDKLSAGGLVAVGLTLTFAAFDWLMSLEPAWYSTIYGIYVSAGGLLAALAFIAVIAHLRARADDAQVTGAEDDRRIALGTLLFAYVMFWAYIAFSQYLIIWIGDVPTEAAWYVARTHHSWAVLAAIIGVGQFGIPFLLLLSRPIKRNARALAVIGAWLVLMHILDVYWLILPALNPEAMRPSWFDAAALFAVAGFAVAAGAWRRPAITEA
jgi:hypothetical protein